MTWELHVGDALEVLPSIPDASISLIATDPPYCGVKDEEWDRQWPTTQAYLDWIGELCQQWRRVLKPNGSLYCFSSPEMSARVECKISECFNVINRITWRKYGDTGNEGGRWSQSNKESLRSFFPQKEEIIFADQYGSDSMAMGESGYEAQCEKLHGFIFEPLRSYLAGEFAALGWNGDRLNEICGTASMAARHYTARSQWCLPTAEHYARLQAAANGHLRREYGHLRREYEDLRRPFFATSDTPYTDVWDFPTIGAYDGKHPCEKPLAMFSHIILTSSRPGDTVFDCFLGSGVCGEAAVKHGRNFVGIEQDTHWVEQAHRRLKRTEAGVLTPFRSSPKPRDRWNGQTLLSFGVE